MPEQQQRQPRPRDVMPNVWGQISQYRSKWGDAHVTECIRRGMAGEPDWFYAFEGGHVVGTPFVADKAIVNTLQLAVAMGGKFAMVMRPPVGASHAKA